MALAEAVVRVRADTSGVTPAVTQEGEKAGKGFAKGFQSGASGTFKGVEKEVNQAARGAAAGSGAFTHLGRSLAFAGATFLGTAKVVDLFRQSLSSAIDEQKQLERANAIFGQQSAGVKKFADQAAGSIGLASGVALKFANDLGQMISPLKLGQPATAALSVELSKLAANMAAARNEDPSTVLAKIEAAMRGRGAGLRTYGIILNDVTLKEEALRLGLVHQVADAGKISAARTELAIKTAQLQKAQQDYGANTTQVASAQLAVTAAQNKLNAAVAGGVPPLTANQKSIAALNIIQQQGAKYADEFAKHGNDQANVMRKLHAEIENLKGGIGQALLPEVTKITKAMQEWLAQSDNQQRVQRDVTQAVQTATSVLKDLWGAFQEGVRILTPVVDKLGGLKRTIELVLALKMAFWVKGIIGGLADMTQALLTTIAKWATVGTAATTAATETTAATATMTADAAALARANAFSGVTTSIEGIGAAATTTAGEVGGLKAALLGLGSPAVMAVLGGIALAIGDIFSQRGGKGVAGLPAGAVQQLGKPISGAAGLNIFNELMKENRLPINKDLGPPTSWTVVSVGGRYYVKIAGKWYEIKPATAAKALGETVQQLVTGPSPVQGVGPRGLVAGAASAVGYASPIPGLQKFVPHISAGGGRQVERVDMGLDFGGTGPIHSIGPGRVLQAGYTAGWSGSAGGAGRGGYVAVMLTDGPRAGWTFYVAEDITVKVSKGQRVDSSTVIAIQHGQIEMGWAGSPSTKPVPWGTLANALGQSTHNAAGQRVPTAAGTDFARFLAGVGANAPLVNKTGTTAGAATRVSGGVGQITAAEINRVAAMTGLPPGLIAAVLQQESGGIQSKFGVVTTSAAGAKGVMQLMAPSAAAAQPGAAGAWANLVQGARQLASYVQKYKKYGAAAIEYALIAYNWGPGNLDKFLARHGGKLAFALLPKDVQSYVNTILGTTGQAATSTTPLVVGQKARVPALPDVTSQKLVDQLAAAQRGVTRAQPAGGSALEAAIRNQIAVEERIIKAAQEYLKKHPGQVKQVHDVINQAKGDIVDLQNQIISLHAQEAKGMAQAQSHINLVDAVIKALGLGDPSALASRAKAAIEAPYKRMTDAALQAILRAHAEAQARIKQLNASLRADVTAGKDVLGTLLGMDPSTTVTMTDEWGRKVTMTIGEVIAKTQALLARLAAAMRSGNEKAKQAALAAWDNWKSEITAAVGAGMDAAAQVVAQKQAAFETAFGRVEQTILTAFDRQTQQGLASIAASYQAQIDQVQAAAQAQIQHLQDQAQKQIQALQDRLQAQIQKLQDRLKKQIDALERQRALPTPQEARLQALQAQQQTVADARSLADAQQAMAEAQLGGDPAAIKAAQRQLDDFLLQQAINQAQNEATISRTARDEEIKAQEDALTLQEQNQEKSLQKQEQQAEAQIQQELQARIDAINKSTEAQVAALQQQEAAAQQEYQDLRDSQRQTLQDQLDAWKANLEAGKVSWDDFTKWLAGNDTIQALTGGKLGKNFADAYIAQLKAAYDAQQALANGQDPTSVNRPALPGGGNSGATPAPNRCFVAGTLIRTPGGDRPIEELQVGDEVLCWDFASGELVVTTVGETFRHDDAPVILHVVTAYGEVRTTPEHPFWAGKEWVPAGKLEPGDFVATVESMTAVELTFEMPALGEPVFNIHVYHPDHNYFAGGLLVHNKGAFQLGGQIPGPLSAPLDDRWALVSTGETVIDRRLTNALKKVFLEGGGGGAAGGNNPMDMLVQLLAESLREHKKQTSLLAQPVQWQATGRNPDRIALEATR